MITSRPDIGTIFETADWYDPEVAGSRTAAETACRDALSQVADERQVRLGPVAWSDLRPGDARAPVLPADRPRRTMLLHAEARVVAHVWYTPKPSRFSQELEHPDLLKLREITRRAWAEGYRRQPYKHLKPWLSDTEADFIIDELGPETARSMLSMGLD
jgi:hypothetical protein